MHFDIIYKYAKLYEIVILEACSLNMKMIKYANDSIRLKATPTSYIVQVRFDIVNVCGKLYAISSECTKKSFIMQMTN